MEIVNGSVVAKGSREGRILRQSTGDSEGSVIVNSVCELDWDKGHPDSWKTLFLHVSVSVSPREISI